MEFYYTLDVPVGSSYTDYDRDEIYQDTEEVEWSYDADDYEIAKALLYLYSNKNASFEERVIAIIEEILGRSGIDESTYLLVNDAKNFNELINDAKEYANKNTTKFNQITGKGGLSRFNTLILDRIVDTLDLYENSVYEDLREYFEEYAYEDYQKNS